MGHFRQGRVCVQNSKKTESSSSRGLRCPLRIIQQCSTCMRMGKDEVLQEVVDFLLAHLSKKGGTSSAPFNKMTLEILLYDKDHGVVLTPAYLPEIVNLGADALSRGEETSEWFISPTVMRWMFRRFGQPQVDIFVFNRSAK